MPPEDGTKKWQSCRKKIKLVDDLVSSAKKKKYPKQHDIPNDVVSCGKRKSEDLPEKPIFNVREKLRAHKIVQYVEDSSSQHDDTADDSDYYPSSQVSQDSLLEMGIKRIESINKVEERRKEKMETSSRMINKNKPKWKKEKKKKWRHYLE